MSILENELDNLLYEVKNKKNLNKDILKKYNNLFNSSEKLFDKILNPNLSSTDLSIIRIMIQKKIKEIMDLLKNMMLMLKLDKFYVIKLLNLY